MSKEIQKSPDENAESALAKISLSDKQSRGGKVWRALLAGLREGAADELKKLPGGSIGAGVLESLQQLADEEAGEEDSRTLDEILSHSQESSDGIKALNAVINLVFAAVGEQNELLEQLTRHLESEDLPSAPEQISEFATQAALAAYRNRVAREYLYAEYRGIEPSSEKVASLPLDDVYVVPRLKPEHSRRDDHEREQDLILRLHNPDFTAEEKAHCEIEYLRMVGKSWHPEGGEALGETLGKARHAVIKGTPGAGKSTLIRYVARLCVADGDSVPDKLRWAAQFTPVVLSLATFADARTETGKQNLTLREFLGEKANDWGGAALEAALEAELSAGCVYIMLDGVDEIPEDDRALVVRKVDAFLIGHENNRTLVTSRPYDYVRLAGDLAHFDLPNFSPEQVKEFVFKWQRAFEQFLKPGAVNFAKADKEAQDTLDEINSNAKVSDLATNPLLLVVISLIRHSNIKLPDKRVELYQAAVKTLMGSWNKFRALSARQTGAELPISRLITAWGDVAHWIRSEQSIVVKRAVLERKLSEVLTKRQFDDNGDPHATAASYLDAAANRSGLLEERGPGYFAFWHPTFEEFLAAKDVATPSHKAAERLQPHLDDPRWREVILLAVGVIGVLNGDEDSAGELVEFIAFGNADDKDKNDPLEPLLHRHLRLAAACVADNAGVPRRTAEKIIVKLAQVVQEFPYEPLTDAFVKTVRAVPNLRPLSETIKVLTPLAKHENWQVRMEATRLFSNVAADNAEARQLCEDLLKDIEDVRCYAALGLARCDDMRKEVWKALSIFFHYKFDEIAAREFLARAQPSAANLVLPWLTDDNAIMRYQAALLLHGMGRADERVAEVLIPLLNSEDAELKYGAAQLLEAMGRTDDAAEDMPSSVLRYPDRVGAAQDLLNRMKITSAYLVGRREAPDSWGPDSSWTRTQYSDAVCLLHEMGKADEQAVDTLFSYLSNEDAKTRHDAARLLHEMGVEDERVMEALLSLLKSEDAAWRCIAAESLHEMGKGDSQVVEALLSLVAGKPTIFRHPAKHLLQIMGKTDESIVKFFLHLTEVDTEKTSLVCCKVLEKQSLTADDVKTLRDLVRQQKNDTSEQKEARRWLFEWLFEALEPKSALAEE